MFLIYPFVNYFYNGSSEEKSNRLDDFHAYLQINPPALKNLDSNKFNIFCLGGSTTEYKDSLGRDWPGLVEKKLNNKLQYEHVELFNYGKAWYSTQHILINYILNLKQYKPNAIIVMENINDLLQNADFSWLSKGKFRDDYGNFLGPMTRILKYGDFATFITKEIKGMWYQSKTAYVETNKFPGLKSFERNLNILISLAKEDSTKIILMTQPNIYKDSMNVNERNALHMLDNEAIGNGKKWTYKTALIGIRQYNQKIREIAFSRNIPLIDLDKIVPKNLEYFYDDVHYNYKTYDLIAAYIAQELENILKNDK
jgi:lysophospholipase L1-like esterase